MVAPKVAQIRCLVALLPPSQFLLLGLLVAADELHARHRTAVERLDLQQRTKEERKEFSFNKDATETRLGPCEIKGANGARCHSVLRCERGAQAEREEPRRGGRLRAKASKGTTKGAHLDKQMQKRPVNDGVAAGFTNWAAQLPSCVGGRRTHCEPWLDEPHTMNPRTCQPTVTFA